MKSPNKVLLLTGLVATLAVGSVVSRVGAEEKQEKPKFPVVEQLIDEKLNSVADLSDDQRGKIRAAICDQLPALKKAATKFVEEQKAIRETVGNPTVDETAIRERTGKLADVLIDYTRQRAAIAVNVKAVLTNEQLDKAGDALANISRFIDEIAKRLARE
jgi:gas vesicle protein